MNYHPAIKRAADRRDISPELIDGYQAVFDACADWFRPTDNMESTGPAPDAYSLAQRLHQIGLLDERRCNLWRKGSYVGRRVEFRQPESIA